MFSQIERSILLPISVPFFVKYKISSLAILAMSHINCWKVGWLILFLISCCSSDDFKATWWPFAWFARDTRHGIEGKASFCGLLARPLLGGILYKLLTRKWGFMHIGFMCARPLRARCASIIAWYEWLIKNAKTDKIASSSLRNMFRFFVLKRNNLLGK